MNDRTWESGILDRLPGLRTTVVNDPEFVAWQQLLPTVDVDDDGNILYVVGGDQLRDLDQIIVAWVRQFRPDLIQEEGI